MAKRDDPPYLSEAPQQQGFTRADVATTRRALHDLQKQAGKLSDAIFQLAATAPHVSHLAFKEAWEKRETLNKMQAQMVDLQAEMESILPSTSTARLSDNERRQIKGLYATGLYTQQQLAEQYGVSQPTIGDIARS